MEIVAFHSAGMIERATHIAKMYAIIANLSKGVYRIILPDTVENAYLINSIYRKYLILPLLENCVDRLTGEAMRVQIQGGAPP